MTRIALLTTVSTIAICAGSVSVATTEPVFPLSKFNIHNVQILYDQNSNDAGTSVNSQNFSSSQLNDQGADDFVVPQGQTWLIKEVDVTGIFYDGSGPATSENVIFYKNKKGMPGSPVTNGTFSNLNGTGGPNFDIALPGKGLKLRSGIYWISVIANMDIVGQGAWGWEVNSKQHGKQAMWQNPLNGFGTGCTTWGTIENCVGAGGPDLMFALLGKVK